MLTQVPGASAEMDVSRFAPSTTGPAHPGTLLAALLCWLDARRSGARLVLRLEDLDPERARPEWSRDLLRDLAWLGLDWDEVESQRERSEDHAQALDRLVQGRRHLPLDLGADHGRERTERERWTQRKSPSVG